MANQVHYTDGRLTVTIDKHRYLPIKLVYTDVLGYAEMNLDSQSLDELIEKLEQVREKFRVVD